MDVPSLHKVLPKRDVYAFSTWIKKSTLIRGALFCFQALSPSSIENMFLVQMLPDGRPKLLFKPHNMNNNNRFVNAPNIPEGNWFHFVVISKPESYSVYINNILIQEKTYSSWVPDSSMNVYFALGQDIDGGVVNDKEQIYLGGTISEFYAFGHNLSEEDIQHLYQHKPAMVQNPILSWHELRNLANNNEVVEVDYPF